MGKRMKKLILAVIVTAMMLSTSIVAFAANDGALKTLQATIKSGAKTKVVKSLTLYAGDYNLSDNTHSHDGSDLGYNMDKLWTSQDGSTPSWKVLRVDALAAKAGPNLQHRFVALSSDKKVATVQTISSTDGYDYIDITAVKGGKATITLTDVNNTKKKFTMKVTVNALTDDITFGNSVSSTKSINRMNIANGGTLSLGAVSNANAKTKMKYELVSQKVLQTDGTKKDAAIQKNKKLNVVDVNAKGVVTAKKAGTAVIRVTALDQKKNKEGYSELVTVNVTNTQTTRMDPKFAGSITLKGKNYNLELKTNTGANTFDGADVTHFITSTGDGTDDGTDRVLYTSSKPAVATVDKNGKITAVSNGKAKITISPADGTKSKTVKNVVINVTVKTDIESKYITVPSTSVTVGIGKNLNLGAKVDKKVTGNKKLNYEFWNMDTDKSLGTTHGATGMTVKNGKLSVAKTGNVSTSDIVVKVSAAANAKAYKLIAVKVINPVKTLKATVPAYDKRGSVSDKKKATTLYLYDGVPTSTYDGMDELSFVGGTIAGYDKVNYGTTAGEDNYSFDKCKIKLDLSYFKSVTKVTDELLDMTKLSFSSKNPAVARVDQKGNITAVGKGKTTITIAANDGSKKKATVSVTVVQKVDKLSIANETKSGLFLEANKTTKLKAVTNADANKKTVEYSFVPEKGAPVATCKSNGSIKVPVVLLKNGESVKLGTMTITATDYKSFQPRQKAWTKTVDVYACSGNDTIKSLEFGTYDGGTHDGLSIKKGTQSSALSELIEVPETVIGKSRELVWETSDKNVLTVDKSYGTITGKAVGVAKVTVKAKTNSGISDTAYVRVGESDQEYRLKMDDRLVLALGADEYDWSGVKPTYEQGQEIIYLNYTNGFAESKADGSFKTNLENLFEVFWDAFGDFDTAVIAQDDQNLVYRFERENAFKVKVYRNDKLIADNLLTEKSKVLNSITKRSPEAYADDSFTITVYKSSTDSADFGGKEKVNFIPLEYSVDYKVVFASQDSTADAIAEENGEVLDMDSVVDDRIASAISSIEYDEVATGISSVKYDAATNTATLNIYNGSMKIADTAQSKARTTVLDVCKTVFKELNHADVELLANGTVLDELSKYAKPVDRHSNTDVDARVNQILDTMVSKLTEKNILELRMLDNTAVRVTARFNNYADPITYTVKFSLNTDAMIDGAILESISALGNASYDTVNNVVTFAWKKNATPTEAEKQAFINIMNAIATKCDSDAYVRSDIDTSEFTKTVQNGNAMTDAAKQFVATTAWTKPTDGDSVYVKNTYASGKTLTYVIEFAVENTASNSKASVTSLEGTVDGEDTAEVSETEVEAEVNVTISDGDVATVSDGDVVEAVVEAVIEAQ